MKAKELREHLKNETIKPKDMTVQGIINWICIQEDCKDMGKLLEAIHKKLDAHRFMGELRQKRTRLDTKVQF